MYITIGKKARVGVAMRGALPSRLSLTYPCMTTNCVALSMSKFVELINSESDPSGNLRLKYGAGADDPLPFAVVIATVPCPNPLPPPACAFGFFILTQSRERPERYAEPSRSTRCLRASFSNVVIVSFDEPQGC
jgi:hypothetical protein